MSRFSRALAVGLLGTMLGPPVAQADEPWPDPMDHRVKTVKVMAEKLELGVGADAPMGLADLELTAGGMRTMAHARLRGGADLMTGAGQAHAELLLARLVSANWELQAGVALGQAWTDAPGNRQLSGTVGLEGLAPYWIETMAMLYVSQTGVVSAEVELMRDVYLTQRLVAELEGGLGASVQGDPAWGTAPGLTAVEGGLRLRYEVRRELAPYLGIMAERALMGTAALTSEPGEVMGVGGVRTWF